MISNFLFVVFELMRVLLKAPRGQKLELYRKQIIFHLYTHTHIYIYMYICLKNDSLEIRCHCIEEKKVTRRYHNIYQLIIAQSRNPFYSILQAILTFKETLEVKLAFFRVKY